MQDASFLFIRHESTIGSIITENVDPQVITGSYDSTIKTWDLAGKCMKTLADHKKGVSGSASEILEFSSASAITSKSWFTRR